MHPFKYLQYHIGLSMELQCTAFFTVLITTNGSFDLAAAEAVLELRDSLPGLRLVAVVPFGGRRRASPMPTAPATALRWLQPTMPSFREYG